MATRSIAVTIEDLRGRFERFRREYLDTAAGRDHLRNQAEEPKEVQTTFEKLRSDRQAGRDITDETLRRLLPHSDTKGNRERGVRISTWPCITKDVRAWFEGAGWKEPSEWPDVANWLLDVAEAGRDRDWDRWRGLAQHPAQKGFACGFISPIVHCLDTGLPIINSKVVKTYAAVASVLGINVPISPALEDYPENQARLLGLVDRLKPLGLDGLDEWDVYCHWNVVKRLGGRGTVTEPRTVALVVDASPEVAGEPAEVSRTTLRQVSESLCEELRQAQHDTTNPDRFEAAVQAAFEALGFEADRIGGSGEADVVARASLGEDSYSLVADAKTTQPGRARGDINYDPIKGHQEQHEADYALVVAPAFSQGNTVQHASNRAVGLLTTEGLVELVRESQRRGLSLLLLREILGQPGMIEVGLGGLREERADLAAVARAVLGVFEEHQRGDETSAGLGEESIFWLLRGTGLKFSRDRIDQAVQLLTNPLIGVLERRAVGYALTIPRSMVPRRITDLGGALTEGDSDRAIIP